MRRLHPCERAESLLLSQSRQDDRQHITQWLHTLTGHTFDQVTSQRLADDFRDIYIRTEGRSPPNDHYSSEQINLSLMLMGDWLDPLLDLLLEFKQD